MTKPRTGRPHVREPQRSQAEIRFELPEDALPPEHPARLLWDVLGRFDLGAPARPASLRRRAGRGARNSAHA
jgi:hypothetical protein